MLTTKTNSRPRRRRRRSLKYWGRCPRGRWLRRELRTAARIATEQTKTFSSDEELNLLRSKVTIHISALVYAWQQKAPLPEGVINRARTAIQAWMEALIVRG